jgi:hypothetical protein
MVSSSSIIHRSAVSIMEKYLYIEEHRDFVVHYLTGGQRRIWVG